MIQEISNLITEIRDTLLLAGLNQDKIAFTKARLEKENEESLRRVRAWLIGFRDNQVRAWKEIRSVHPESKWKYYESVGIDDLTEHRILKEKTKALKLTWSVRPRCLKRKKDNAPDPQIKKLDKKSKTKR